MNTLLFKTQKGADCQVNVVTMRDFEAELDAFDTGKVLEVAMAGFNGSSIWCGVTALEFSYPQIGSGSVFRGALCINRPKPLHQYIACQMQSTALCRDVDVRNRASITRHLDRIAIVFQASQPFPLISTHAFQAVQAAVATVEGDKRRAQARGVRYFQRVLKMVILVKPIIWLCSYRLFSPETA